MQTATSSPLKDVAFPKPISYLSTMLNYISQVPLRMPCMYLDRLIAACAFEGWSDVFRLGCRWGMSWHPLTPLLERRTTTLHYWRSFLLRSCPSSSCTGVAQLQLFVWRASWAWILCMKSSRWLPEHVMGCQLQCFGWLCMKAM